MTLDQRVVLAPDDGSLGPLLRIADDRLGPGERYGSHEHRAVDVVAVVVRGSVRHDWAGGALLAAGDVAVLRAGRGVRHDERAGDDGARLLQCYLRPGEPDGEPAHAVHPGAAGWLDLGHPDARLWVAFPSGADVDAPSGLRVVAGPEDVRSELRDAGSPVTGADVVLVWRLDRSRPGWASR